MSYDLAVWEGDRPRDDEHARDVLDALRALHPVGEVAPTALIRTYVEALKVRWPEPRPWIDASLIGSAAGPLLYFGVRPAAAPSIGPDAAFIARSLGLVCFDPQLGRLVHGLADPAHPTWTLVVSVDPEFFAAHGSDGYDEELPAAADRRLELTDSRTRIGRFSRKHVVHPQIDLSVGPADPWVSRAHADLALDLDGRLWLIDLGSEHGVYLNDATAPLPARKAAALNAGDRIHLGRWTTITIGRHDASHGLKQPR